MSVRTEEEMNSIAQPAEQAATNETRPYYWSVCRELWENRSLYIAPAIVAVVQVFGFAVSAVGLAERRRAVLLLESAKIRTSIEQPYDVIAMMMMFTIFVVGIFYCLDSLYSERRDRSILFWKSLPVSDLTTLLSKATVPLAILPVIAFVFIVVVQLIMILITSVILVSHGMSPASTWQYIPFFQNWLVLAYGLVALSLWLAPIYGWLFLVSASVRHAAFLWAVLPWIALVFFERLTFGTSYVPELIKYRLMGFAPEAFDFLGQKNPCINSLAQLTPMRYLGSPGLWVGLIVAAVCIFGAIRLRRIRGPI